MTDGFEVGIEFDSVLAAISKQIYETPLAFIRENVQNAVDALRIQARRQDILSSDASLRVDVAVSGTTCEITDNGNGMSLGDLQNLFWTIGASGKRTAEARTAGCVGMFGIGGFANFGVCTGLTVVSQPADADGGHATSLTRDQIEQARGAIPTVSVEESEDAAPRGTVVRGHFQDAPAADQLRLYLEDFVRHTAEHVYFNGDLISRQEFAMPDSTTGALTELDISDRSWTNGSIEVHGRLYEARGHVLQASLTGATLNGEAIRLNGWLRFENGPLAVLKRGFRICTTSVATQIGVTGAIDCDRLAPTAGRDSLDPESSSFVAAVVACMERAAVLAILETPERIAQHTRVFKYIRRNGLVPELGNTIVELADGSGLRLDELRTGEGQTLRTFFAKSKDSRLSQLLQARGHTVVQLPADGHKQAAVRDFLVAHCAAEPFEGKVECAEVYAELSRFERVFLSELEETIVEGFEVREVTLVPGRLTEDVPVYAPDAPGDELTVYVDVRHDEITKLEALGITSLFRSVVGAFCREYLGPALRSRSPKFFGSGAINLDLLASRRSELWVLATRDIEVLSRSSHRQVVTTADVAVVRVGGTSNASPPEPSGPPPKLIKIEGSDKFADLDGYYLRVPTGATLAYGDVIMQCDDRGAVWAGNKISLVASDGVSTAFQFEVRLDRLLTSSNGLQATNGAVELARSVQAMYDGLYFPLPEELEEFLVPTSDTEVRLEVRCDWIDFSSARSWSSQT